MDTRTTIAALALLFAAACTSDSDADSNLDEHGAGGKADAFASDDVQVLSARATTTVTWDMDLTTCEFFDVMPWTGGGGGYTSQATADCTDALIAATGRPSINMYVEPLMWLRGEAEVTDASPRHFCSGLEVVVAIKSSVFEDPEFEGIGFYAAQSILNESSEHQTVFYTKDDERLVRAGQAQLRTTGETVFLYQFGGAGPCAVNGVGDNPSGKIEFKPYLGFAGENESWEAIDGNHGLAYGQSWDRSADLID